MNDGGMRGDNRHAGQREKSRLSGRYSENAFTV